ncbi:TonB-dependent receptor plug domain-containing protein [Gelidibacter pelagius]|uniref:TonB-dependent receptor n=1 Tax=Gelidibacter pelagius TaxID=2819985 RepID=A0ABS3SUE7_9FLAO|nr:TonB-dependent receptor [Gelidibacter pelagius]MBO3099311.1 TonB-dependent receptor [Gelidibacter pelagius]
MRTYLKRITIFIFGLLFCPTALWAQTQDTLTPVALPEIFLRHDKNRFESHTSPAPVQSLSGEQLKKLNSLSVADALRYFSGIQLKDYGGIGGIKTVNVRSMGSQHTGVFFDGIQLGNAQNGQVDLGKFSLDNMQQVSLYQGQRSEMQQSAKAYASSNTIYLQTKTPKFEPDETYQLAVGVRSGSFGLFNPSLNLNYKINDAISARLSTELVNAHGRYKFQYSNGIYDTTAVRNNADIKSYRVEASIHGNHKNKDIWNVKYYHYNSERGLPGAIVANRFARPQRLWDRNNFLQADYKHQFGETYAIKVRGKYGDDYSRYLDPEIVTTTGFLENTYDQQEYYLSLVHTYKVKPYWTLSLATDVQHNAMQSNMYRFAYPKRTTLLNVLASDFNFKRLTIQASLLSTGVYESVKYYEAADDFQEFSPSLLFNVQPFKSADFRLRGFYKKMFRMPTFNDLYYTFVGNTFLDPEYSEQINLGFSWQKNLGSTLLNVTSDIYNIWITDKIVAIPGTNLFRWTMYNLGEVETKGIETSVTTSGKISADINYSARLTYTFQESLDKTPGGNSFGQQIPYVPKHSGSATLMMDYKNIALNYSFIYTGERYSQKANIASNYLQPWYTHDISVNYELPIFEENPLEFGLEVNNLFDQHYAVIKNFPMPGRSFRLNLNYQF